MEQKFECKHCGTKFHKAGTLSTHICVKKRRHAEINTPASRAGLRTFQKFFEMTMNSKKVKTAQEFIDSPYYIDFAKFGNHLATLKPIYPDQFIEFVIKNSVKLKDWTKDFVYDLYIEDIIKKEPAESATERTITEIMEWCEKNGTIFSNFFSDISANEAAYLIKVGRISPWVLYLANSGDQLMTRFNEDHGKMIGKIIDPGFWKKKFKQSDNDVEFIRGLLTQTGL
jgi:hypothetical protein